jgi:hypothetical protein
MGTDDKGCEGVVWIRLAQDKDQWWAPVNTVTNLRLPYIAKIFFVSQCNVQRYKSPGIGQIPVKMIQAGGETLRSEIHNSFILYGKGDKTD